MLEAVGDGGINWDDEARRVAAVSKWPSWAGPDCDYFKEFIKPNDRLLDLGCNIAQCCGIFHSIEPTIRYVGLDMSSVAIKVARERYPESQFFCMNAKEMEFKEEFDVIFTHTFYQHNYLEGQKIIIPRVHQALKPGGYHIIEENTSGDMSEFAYSELFASFGFEPVKIHDIGAGGSGMIFRRALL